MCERELERTQREQQDKIQELEMKKMKEEELKKKSKKPGKKDPKEATRKKNLPDGKQSVCAIHSLHASSCWLTVTKAALYQTKLFHILPVNRCDKEILRQQLQRITCGRKGDT